MKKLITNIVILSITIVSFANMQNLANKKINNDSNQKF